MYHNKKKNPTIYFFLNPVVCMSFETDFNRPALKSVWLDSCQEIITLRFRLVVLKNYG